MASIARKNLLEDIPRFLVAQAGIIFAVSLITIQIGILQGFTTSTTLLIDNNPNIDIWLSSDEIVYFELTQPLPFSTVDDVLKVEGVAAAEPFLLQTGRWRSETGKIAPIRFIGFEPLGRLFRLWNVTEGRVSDLAEPQTIMTDEANLKSLQIEAVGDVATINAATARLVGLARGTQSIASSKFIFASLENIKGYATAGLSSRARCVMDSERGFVCTTEYERDDSSDEENATFKVQSLSSVDPITYVLIKAAPGQDIRELAQRLETQFENTRANTRAELSEMTRSFWRRSTGVGFILALGAAVGIIVGMVVVGQILYSSVSDHIKEFGTLKAMGASDWIIYKVIIEQSLWMAVLGYLPSMLLCFGLGAWTFETQGIRILITPLTAFGVFLVTTGMCVGSALFAIQKVMRVDPAIVFKA